MRHLRGATKKYEDCMDVLKERIGNENNIKCTLNHLGFKNKYILMARGKLKKKKKKKLLRSSKIYKAEAMP